MDVIISIYFVGFVVAGLIALDVDRRGKLFNFPQKHITMLIVAVAWPLLIVIAIYVLLTGTDIEWLNGGE